MDIVRSRFALALASVIAVVCSGAAGQAFGQAAPSPKTPPATNSAPAEQGAPAETPASADFEYRSAVFSDLLDTGKKLLSLAQATPEDKFTWRPSGDGAYSVSEVYLLAASQYYHLPYTFGAIRAAGYEFEGDDVTGGRGAAPPFEKSTTSKDRVILELIDSFSYFKNIMPTLTDADLDKPITLSGRRTTPNGGLFLMATDLHEYLAQAVDYARQTGVVLPWMNEEQQRREKQGQRTPPR
jgi:hypothetical protein